MKISMPDKVRNQIVFYKFVLSRNKMTKNKTITVQGVDIVLYEDNSKDFISLFTKEELIERAAFSNRQIKKGLVVSQKELEKQSKNW